MQTFLPYSDFAASARALDYRRLGKQRVEAFQILKALRDPSYGWQNHPAVRMWRGYDTALKMYYNAIRLEWIRRGYRNTMKPARIKIDEKVVMPIWLGDADFHASHRSNLLRKDFEHYSRLGWDDDPNAEYIWPVS
jgi:hypothetical protein